VSGERLSLAVAAACTCVFAWASTATADDYRYKSVAADKAAANRAVLKLKDVGPSMQPKSDSGKAGGSKDNCPGPGPKLSDLVVTGKAESEFRSQSGGVIIYSMAEVFETVAMLETSWRREVQSSYVADCARASFAAGIRTMGRITSFKQLRFPQIGSHTRAFRVLLRYKNGNSAVVDTIMFARGRMFYALIMGGVIDTPQAPSLLRAADQQFASIMISRGNFIA
jgi:hypothetical protein